MKDMQESEAWIKGDFACNFQSTTVKKKQDYTRQASCNRVQPVQLIHPYVLKSQHLVFAFWHAVINPTVFSPGFKGRTCVIFHPAVLSGLRHIKRTGTVSKLCFHCRWVELPGTGVRTLSHDDNSFHMWLCCCCERKRNLQSGCEENGENEHGLHSCSLLCIEVSACLGGGRRRLVSRRP